MQPKLIDLKRLLSSHIIIRSDCFQKDFTLLDIIAKRQERHNLFDYLSKKKASHTDEWERKNNQWKSICYCKSRMTAS